jgi:drug/metabolite transporter (DMT)-like permease
MPNKSLPCRDAGGVTDRSDARTFVTSCTLILVAIAVDGTIPWLQGVVARNPSFQPSAMVLVETSTYVFGGLAVAGCMEGRAGIERCLSLKKYISYMPAALAFSICNVLTYIAVKGIGASQFVLLVQLRVVVVAVLGCVMFGQRRSLLEWVTLVQLALSMCVLVGVEALLGHHDEPEAVQNNAQFYSSAAALAGVVVLCGFAYVYMEGQLKASNEPLYIQQHQLSFFGMATSFWLYTVHRLAPHNLVHAHKAPEQPVGESRSQCAAMVALLALVVSRGLLTSLVLKKFDSVIKGLVDVASIVYCALLQLLFDGLTMDRTTAGLQFVVLMSIVQYFLLRPAPDRGAESERQPINADCEQVKDAGALKSR